ncbi:MAG: beta-galactosidase [Planctomycetota bacterium]
MFTKIVMALLFCPLMAMGIETMNITSFETEADLQKIKFNNTKGERVAEHATDGQHALKLHFEKVAWPGISFHAGEGFERADWSAFGSILFDVHNPENEDVRVCVRIDDDKKADGRIHCIQGGAEVPAGATKTLFFTLRCDEFNMRGLPQAIQGMIGIPRDKREIDLTRVVQFLIFVPKPDKEHTLYLDNIRLAPSPRMEGIVDRFGQYTGADWPGKVHEVSDLEKRRDEEAEYLNTAPVPQDRDEYGGWAKGPQLEATGFFRAEKVDGKWWLVTPSGHLFWSVGLDCVRCNDGSTPTRGREYMFTWLPQANEAAHEIFHGKDRYFSFYQMNVIRKYGADLLPPWLDVTFKRMRTWGFNTVGNWSADEVFRARKVPYTVPIHYGGVPAFHNGWREIVDVFDDKFSPAVEAAIARGTSQWRDDPWCIGYFVDNELSWGGWEDTEGYILPRNVLAAPGALAAKREFVSHLKQKYGDVEKMSQAWGIKAVSWEEFEKAPVELPKEATEAMRGDFVDFTTHFARRYFTVVRDAMKRHAPKQLYLGCRIASKAPDVVEKLQAEFADVCCYNWYCKPEDFVERTKRAAALDRPVVIGEFHFGALDRGMFHTGLGPVASQEERGKAYVGYVTEALKQPWCVGAHWFIYVDQALTGRFDGENYNIGFVTVTDTVYSEISDAARGINFRIYEIRSRKE